MNAAWRRIYADYLAPSRLDEFRRLLCFAREHGYEHRSLLEFHRAVRAGDESRTRVFLHRHDVDTDPGTAGQMFEIEKAHEIRSTYYFRLSTLDFPLMRDIEDYGSEVGYHYEEVATYCKAHGIVDPKRIQGVLPEIRACFRENFRRLEAALGRKIRSVASHGDFANRKLGITNTVLLDADLRRDLQIEFEDYDVDVRARYSVTLSDSAPPVQYRGSSPFEAIEQGRPVIHLLTHPRHWRTNSWINTRENLLRLYEGARWKLTRRRRVVWSAFEERR